MVFASAVPTSWGLELAGTLTLLALVIKACEHLAMVVGGINYFYAQGDGQ